MLTRKAFYFLPLPLRECDDPNDRQMAEHIKTCLKKSSNAKNINIALRLWERDRFFIVCKIHRFIFMTLGVGPRQVTERGNLASRLWERDRARRPARGACCGHVTRV